MAHETQLITKRAWQGPGGPEGYLTVTNASLRWQPAHTGPELCIPLASISNQQRAKDKPLVRIALGPAPAAPGGPPPGPTHHVFAFESVADRDAALDVLTKVIAALSAGSGGAAPGGAPGKGAAPEGPAVAGGFTRQQRQAMLARDPDLRALWEDLVGGGAVSEGDFWSGVAARLAAAQPSAWGTAGGGGGPGAPRRRLGLSNILQRVEAEVDGRHQRVLRVSLSPEQVAQIFAEQPAVLRAYREHVPHRMAEEDFWRRYVRHEMHKESKRKARAEGLGPAAAAAAVVDDAGGDIFREAAAAVAAEAAARPGAAAAAREAVDPSLDLGASEGERYTGHGTAHAATREPELDSERLAAAPGGAHGPHEDPDDLAAALNRHGEVVLQGVEALARVEAQLRAAAAGGKAPPHPHGHHQGGHGGAAEGAEGAPGGRRRRRHSSGLEDLHAPPAPALEALRIADPRRYFERSGGAGAGAEHADAMDLGLGMGLGLGPGGGLAGALSCVDPGRLPLPPVAPAEAQAALLEATPLARVQAEDEAAGPGGAPVPRASAGAPRDPASSLPRETMAALRRTALAVNEACRHFWRCVPPNTAARRDKASRLVRLLEAKRSEVEALNDRARGVEGRFIRQLLKPPMDMLLTALVRWDEELQKHPHPPHGKG